jgi:hypothetical protein
VIFAVLNIHKKYLALLLAITGVFAPGFIGLIGVTTNDNLLSAFVILAMYLIVKALNRFKTFIPLKYVFVASLSIGIAVGLKLTMAIYFISFFVCLIFVSPKKDIIKNIFILVAVAGLGLLLVNGHWMYVLYSKFQNPIFPFYNQIFQSEYFSNTNIADTRFLPKSIVDFIFFPITTLLDTFKIAEVPFRDIRFVLAYILLILMFIKAIVLKQFKMSKVAVFMLLNFVVAYIVWALQFGIYRYSISLEIICPLIIFIIMHDFTKKYFLNIIVCLCLLIVLFVSPTNWGRIDFVDSYFNVQPYDFTEFENSTVYIDNKQPISYIVPYFPKSTSFVSISPLAKIHRSKDSKLAFYLTNEPGLLNLETAKNDLSRNYDLELIEQLDKKITANSDIFTIYRLK